MVEREQPNDNLNPDPNAEWKAQIAGLRPAYDESSFEEVVKNYPVDEAEDEQEREEREKRLAEDRMHHDGLRGLSEVDPKIAEAQALLWKFLGQ